jgi:hypothetical protein
MFVDNSYEVNLVSATPLQIHMIFSGRLGKSVTLVTQFDINLVHSIEAFVSEYNTSIIIDYYCV